VHRYFSVDWAVVWKISQEELPVLEEQAVDIMRAELPELAKTGPAATAGRPGTRPGPALSAAGRAYGLRPTPP
jgi:hypothetical protein